MLVCIGFVEYLDAERFVVRRFKRRDFCVNIRGLIRLAAHVRSSCGSAVERLLRKLKLMPAMDVLFVRDPGKLVYAKKLDELY